MYTIFAMINVIGRFARSAEMRQQDKESIRQSYVARYSFYAYTDCFKIRLIFQNLPFLWHLSKLYAKYWIFEFLLLYFTCRKKIPFICRNKQNVNNFKLTFVEKASSHSVQKRFSSFSCSNMWDLRLAILAYFLPHSGHFGSPMLCVAIWSVKFVCNDTIVRSY